MKHDRLFLVSVMGFLVNLIGIFAFQGHGHSHGGGGHGHSHSESVTKIELCIPGLYGQVRIMYIFLYFENIS